MDRLCFLQRRLDSLPDIVSIRIERTIRTGEVEDGKRNIYGEKSTLHCDWVGHVRMPCFGNIPDAPFQNEPRYTVAHTLDVIYKEMSGMEICDGYVRMFDITVEANHLGLVMLRTYRAANWMLGWNGTPYRWFKIRG